jgi:hypothetical protein
MTEPSQPPQEKQKDSQEKTGRIKQKLIWLGIVLAIFGALDVGYLIYRVAHPSL